MRTRTMKVWITTPMTLEIEGEDMLEIADKYWAAVPECCISDNQYELIIEGDCEKPEEFLAAYQYVTQGMDEEEIEEYLAEHPEIKNSKLYREE